MSSKIKNPPSSLSTEHVDKTTGEVVTRYVPPRLNKAGQELPSAITLVAVPALRDFDLGTRIQRFQSVPQSLQARYDEAFDDDNVTFDNYVDTDDVNPMSPHELRFGEVRSQLRDKQKLRIEEADKKRKDAFEAEKAKYRAIHKELVEEGTLPPQLPENNA